jgi:hypothetical protein
MGQRSDPFMLAFCRHSSFSLQPPRTLPPDQKPRGLALTFPNPDALVPTAARQQPPTRTPSHAFTLRIVSLQRAYTLPFCLPRRTSPIVFRSRLSSQYVVRGTFPDPDGSVEGGCCKGSSVGGEGDLAEGSAVT